MRVAGLFMNGRSQAVRLAREFQFKGIESIRLSGLPQADGSLGDGAPELAGRLVGGPVCGVGAGVDIGIDGALTQLCRQRAVGEEVAAGTGASGRVCAVLLYHEVRL
jgi:hypothetical protein